MNLPLNNLQLAFLSETLEPYRNSPDRHKRNLVRKLDRLMAKQAELDTHVAEFIATFIAPQAQPENKK